MSDKKNKLKALEAMMEEGSRMADPSEIENLKNIKAKTSGGFSKALVDGVPQPVDTSEMLNRMKGTPSIDDLAAPKNIGERMASKSQIAALQKAGSKVGQESSEGLFSKIASKVGSKGLGKVAAGVAGLPLLLASEAADASELGESAEDDNMMIAEAQARNDYNMSPAHTDKLRASGQVVPELPANEAFSRMRALKDGRREDILKGQEGGSDIKEMMDVKESIQDRAESNLSQEQREEIAQRNLDKKRKGLGLGTNQAIRPNQGEEV